MQKIQLVTILLFLTTVALAGDFEDGEAAFQRGDYATALTIFRTLAEQGDAFAQNNLGVMYDLGHGVPQDDNQAFDWYARAAKQGNAFARYNIETMYDQSARRSIRR